VVIVVMGEAPAGASGRQCNSQSVVSMSSEAVVAAGFEHT
jgi:hypothetical protein